MHYLVFFGTLLLLALFDLRELSLVEANVDKDADACSLRPKSPHPRLVRFTLDPRETTVSGISNGGAFATHISFIYSSLIHGAGIFAATPFPLLYLLSKWNTQALAFNSELYPVIDEWSAKGWIDSTDNLRGFKAYVYQGTRDRLIYPTLVKNVVKEFQHYGADVKDMTSLVSSGHCIPTNTGMADPTVGRLQGVCTNAGYEGISDMFSHFYGAKFVSATNISVPSTGRLFKSDISEFYPKCNSETFGISSQAWTYVPNRCTTYARAPREGQKCKLHFAFHGYALPVRARVYANSRNAFVEFAGYLQTADLNDVIIIFPEANWRGYDVLGYTGRDEYVRKSGVQNIAIKKMIDRLIHGK